MLKYFAGDYCLLVPLVLLSCETNLTLERVFFLAKFLVKRGTRTYCTACLKKRYYFIVRTLPVRYVQVEDCNTRLHETLST